MPDLWEAITDVVTVLHPSWVEVLADSIAKGPASNLAIPVNIPRPAPEVEALFEAWRNVSWWSPNEVAVALRAASATRRILAERSGVQLVWTGPEVGCIPVRHTEQALLEVIREAKQDLFIVSFVAMGIESVSKALRESAGRGVRVRFLLELSKDHGGVLDVDSIRLMREAHPAAGIYVWRQEVRTGSVHAKCAVADGSVAFITSANLTQAALDRNMELGVLLRGGVVPERLREHLEMLISKRIATEWNGM